MKQYIVLILTTLLLSACSFINEPFEDCPVERQGEAIQLSFQLMTTSPFTRTDDSFHLEEDSELRQLEDGIDFSDFGLFIFARLSSDAEGGERLVIKNTDISSSSNKDIIIDGALGDYTISMMILRSQLHDIIFGEDSEQQIDPNGVETITFRILIVANCNSSETNAQEKWDEIDGTTFSEVIHQLDEWHYDMSNLYNGSYEGEDVEGLFNNTKKNIPMFGTNIFQTSQAALYYSRPEDRVFLGEIDLLRALAKVRVVDNIQNKNADGYPKIIKAEFIGSQNGALPLPYEASKYINGKQVHTPNILSDNPLSPEGAFTYRLGEMPLDLTSILPADRTGAVLVGFVPEQTIGNTGTGSGIPGFKITIEYFENKTMDFVVPMYGYNGKKFEFGDYILRNHIYTLSVERAEAEITLEAIEAPYNSVELEPEFGELYDPEVTEE
ncbi:MAG: hypothetical protein K2N35_15370 [Muribaculaceae bacterium]|nr:hypothetical protein [Muribaculaceae bacterium]